MEDLIPFLKVAVEIILIAIVTIVIGLIYKRIARKRKDSLFFSFIYHAGLVCIYVLGAMCAIAAVPQLSRLASTIMAGSGILALAISLSAQESLSNIVSGLFITLFKPFDVGDRVTLKTSSVTGHIESITLRHTIVKTLNNARVVVPNSIMNKEIVENCELIDPTASYFLDVPVAYESDLDKAKEVISDVVYNHPLYLKENPIVIQLRAFEASGIALRVKVWTKTIDENFEACSDIRFALHKRFKQEGIEIPYSKLVVYKGDEN